MNSLAKRIAELEVLADEALDDAIDGMERFGRHLVELFEAGAGQPDWNAYRDARWGKRLGLSRERLELVARSANEQTGNQTKTGEVLGVTRARANQLIRGKTGNESKEGASNTYTQPVAMRTTHSEPEHVPVWVGREDQPSEKRWMLDSWSEWARTINAIKHEPYPAEARLALIGEIEKMLLIVRHEVQQETVKPNLGVVR